MPSPLRSPLYAGYSQSLRTKTEVSLPDFIVGSRGLRGKAKRSFSPQPGGHGEQLIPLPQTSNLAPHLLLAPSLVPIDPYPSRRSGHCHRPYDLVPGTPWGMRMSRQASWFTSQASSWSSPRHRVVTRAARRQPPSHSAPTLRPRSLRRTAPWGPEPDSKSAMGCRVCVDLEASGVVQQSRWFGAVLSGLCLLSVLVLLEWPWAPAETAWSAAVRGQAGRVRGGSIRGPMCEGVCGTACESLVPDILSQCVRWSLVMGGSVLLQLGPLSLTFYF